MLAGHSRGKATCLGGLTLLGWTTSAPLAVWLGEIPLYQFSYILFLVGSLVSALLVTLRGDWAVVRSQLPMLAGLAPVVWINQVAYVAAIRLAAPEEIELIYYLWPILVVLGTGFARGESFGFTQPLAALMGFSGLLLLLANDRPLWSDLNAQSFVAWALAFLAGLTWAGYTLFSSSQSHSHPLLPGLACAPAAVLSLSLHLVYEDSSLPQPDQVCMLAVWGAVVLGLSLATWDYGVTHGHFQLLSVLSYCVPIGSLLWLVLLGWSESTSTLWGAALLIFAGSLCSGLSTRVEKAPVASKLAP